MKCRLRTTLLPRRSSQVVKPARIASRALWSAVSLAESAAFAAYEASSVASALAPWSAVMLASRPASCAAKKASVARPSRAFAIFAANVSCHQLRSSVRLCRTLAPSCAGLAFDRRHGSNHIESHPKKTLVRAVRAWCGPGAGSKTEAAEPASLQDRSRGAGLALRKLPAGLNGARGRNAE